MDLFRFPKCSGVELDILSGELVNGWDSLMWIERYRDFCEFELIAKIDTDIQKILPIGTLISHAESTEVMIVENHEINQEKGSEAIIKITGRSFETFLENRVVGANQDWVDREMVIPEYLMAPNYTWEQATRLINNHIRTDFLWDSKDSLLNVRAVNGVEVDESNEEVSYGVYQERVIKKGEVYSGVITLLEIDNLGIRTVRPNYWNNELTLFIHSGEDKSSSVAFSYEYGDIDSADYLWSNKKSKTCAYILGRWVDQFIDSGEVGYDRRTMIVDASDIDNQFSAYPQGSDLDEVITKLLIRGYEALSMKNNVAIINAKISSSSQTYKYRTDYNVGDIVSVRGDYNTSARMRVIEHVEIEDETGESSYPTLTDET